MYKIITYLVCLRLAVDWWINELWLGSAFGLIMCKNCVHLLGQIVQNKRKGYNSPKPELSLDWFGLIWSYPWFFQAWPGTQAPFGLGIGLIVNLAQPSLCSPSYIYKSKNINCSKFFSMKYITKGLFCPKKMKDFYQGCIKIAIWNVESFLINLEL